ncbi:MAG: asparagine synthase (glutamine-hydrolyzing) [bacterium]
MMCGICGGVLSDSKRTMHESLLKDMMDQLIHRGPDSEGTYCDGPVGLGHRRLSIIDLSPLGRQPMSNEDGSLYLVVNGEIYNHKTLRKELEAKGHNFRSKSDSEVVLHLYEEMREDLLSHLFGMFSLALWDGRNKRLFLARDRVGKKPLFYSITNTGIFFGSEIKALLKCPDVRREINLEALHHYLTFEYVPHPLTIYKGIKKLPPAHYLIWENGNLQIKRYWDLHYNNKHSNASFQSLKSEFLDRFEDAVRIRMMSDVPLGAFLSGGIDSSATVAMMSRLSNTPVKTFSIGFDDHAYNELSFARRVAQIFKTEHHEFIVKPNATEILPKLIWHYDEPYADSSAIPTYYLAKMTRSEVTVALNGDGGDESFAGYERYLADYLAGIYTRLPGWTGPYFIKKLINSLPCDYRYKGYIRRLKRFVNALDDKPERRYCRWICFFDNNAKGKIYTHDFASKLKDSDSYSYIEEWYEKAKADTFLDRTLYVDVHTYLPDDLMVKVDIATMAHSLEARSPFLDHRLMEFAASLPHNFKLRGWQTKYFLKKAFEGLLPKEILNRPKMGFGVPLDIWFRTDLKDMAYDILLSRRSIDRGYFRQEEIQNLLDAHSQKKADNSYRIWALLILELWHLNFIDK